MSEADKLFEELGYKRYEETDFITMQELQAINLKCKELGWL